MTEVVHPRDAQPVTLGACPSWCTLSGHFAGGAIVDASDGYHHRGPEIEVPSSYRPYREVGETVVPAILKSWTHPLGAGPGQAVIELNLGTADTLTDACAEITPAEARAIAAALLELAETADRVVAAG